MANTQIYTLLIHITMHEQALVVSASSPSFCPPPMQLFLSSSSSSPFLLPFYFLPGQNIKSPHLSAVWISCQSPLRLVTLPRWPKEMCACVCMHVTKAEGKMGGWVGGKCTRVCVSSAGTSAIFLRSPALESKICEVRWEAVSCKRNIVDMNEAEGPTSSFPATSHSIISTSQWGSGAGLLAALQILPTVSCQCETPSLEPLRQYLNQGAD